MPASGDEASACRRRGMRPAPRARRPASTAARMAWAIATGSWARAIALAHSTPSQPSSMASAASLAVPDAGVEDHRHAGALDDEREVVGVADPHARADRRAQRHDRRAADVLQAAGEDRVVVGVGQDDEAVGHELLGRQQQLGRVGQQRALVADDLELDPVGLERLAGQPRGDDGVAGREAAGGVGQQLDAAVLEDVDERAARRRIDAPQGDGDELGARGADGLGQRLQAREAAGAEDQARAQRAPGDLERRVGDRYLLGAHESASLHGGQRLDAVARVDAVRRPFGPGDDLPVDGDGDTAGALLDAEVGQQLDDRRAVALARLAVEDDHAVRLRRGGGEALGPEGVVERGSPASSATTRSAVTGASSTPLR